MTGAKPSAQGDKRFKEKPDDEWNRGSGDLRARPHPVKLLTYENDFCDVIEHGQLATHQQQNLTLQPRSGFSLVGYQTCYGTEKCVVVNKDESSWRSKECFDIRHGDTSTLWGLPRWFSVLLWSSVFSLLLFPLTLDW